MIDGIQSLDASFPSATPLSPAPAVSPVIDDGSPSRTALPAVSSRTPPPPEAIIRFRAAMADATGTPLPDSSPTRLVKADAIASYWASAMMPLAPSTPDTPRVTPSPAQSLSETPSTVAADPVPHSVIPPTHPQTPPAPVADIELRTISLPPEATNIPRTVPQGARTISTPTVSHPSPPPNTPAAVPATIPQAETESKLDVVSQASLHKPTAGGKAPLYPVSISKTVPVIDPTAVPQATPSPVSSASVPPVLPAAPIPIIADAVPPPASQAAAPATSDSRPVALPKTSSESPRIAGDGPIPPVAISRPAPFVAANPQAISLDDPLPPREPASVLQSAPIPPQSQTINQTTAEYPSTTTPDRQTFPKAESPTPLVPHVDSQAYPQAKQATAPTSKLQTIPLPTVPGMAPTTDSEVSQHPLSLPTPSLQSIPLSVPQSITKEIPLNPLDAINPVSPINTASFPLPGTGGDQAKSAAPALPPGFGATSNGTASPDISVVDLLRAVYTPGQDNSPTAEARSQVVPHEVPPAIPQAVPQSVPATGNEPLLPDGGILIGTPPSRRQQTIPQTAPQLEQAVVGGPVQQVFPSQSTSPTNLGTISQAIPQAVPDAGNTPQTIPQAKPQPVIGTPLQQFSPPLSPPPAGQKTIPQAVPTFPASPFPTSQAIPAAEPQAIPRPAAPEVAPASTPIISPQPLSKPAPPLQAIPFAIPQAVPQEIPTAPLADNSASVAPASAVSAPLPTVDSDKAPSPVFAPPPSLEGDALNLEQSYVAVRDILRPAAGSVPEDSAVQPSVAPHAAPQIIPQAVPQAVPVTGNDTSSPQPNSLPSIPVTDSFLDPGTLPPATPQVDYPAAASSNPQFSTPPASQGTIPQVIPQPVAASPLPTDQTVPATEPQAIPRPIAHDTAPATTAISPQPLSRPAEPLQAIPVAIPPAVPQENPPAPFASMAPVFPVAAISALWPAVGNDKEQPSVFAPPPSLEAAAHGMDRPYVVVDGVLRPVPETVLEASKENPPQTVPHAVSQPIPAASVPEMLPTAPAVPVSAVNPIAPVPSELPKTIPQAAHQSIPQVAPVIAPDIVLQSSPAPISAPIPQAPLAPQAIPQLPTAVPELEPTAPKAHVSTVPQAVPVPPELPKPIPQAAPQPIPQATPAVVPDTVLQSSPAPIPAPIPQAMPQLPTAPTSQATLVSTPQAAPISDAASVLRAILKSSLGSGQQNGATASPQTAPQPLPAIPQAENAPQAIPDTAPVSEPQVIPQATPDFVPQALPQTIPQATSEPTAQTRPVAPSVPQASAQTVLADPQTPASPAATPETPRVFPAIPANVPSAKPAARTPALSSPDIHDTPDTLQALPVTPPPEPPAIPVEAILEPSLAAEIARASAKMLSVAVEEVAAAMRATPALAQGEGLLHIQLKADILDGSQIQLSLSGGTLTVQIDAATPDAQALVERYRPQLEAALVARTAAPGGTYHTVHVTVKKGNDDETV